jgi:hypothetical protein
VVVLWPADDEIGQFISNAWLLFEEEKKPTGKTNSVLTGARCRAQI